MPSGCATRPAPNWLRSGTNPSRTVLTWWPASTGIWLRSTSVSGPAEGVGAGLLQGRRCGACRIEIDKGELARIAAAADDEVLRCPECAAILLRVKGFRA